MKIHFDFLKRNATNGLRLAGMGFLFAFSLTCEAGKAPLQFSCKKFAFDLQVMVEADQAVRSIALSANAPGSDASVARRVFQMAKVVEERNIQMLKTYIGRCGWPTTSKYGASTTLNAFILVQHADGDRAFQHQVLALLGKLVAAKEVPGIHVAYLDDRLAIAEGRTQLYGTQLRSENGCISGFAPMDSRAAVEQRRVLLELLPLDDYFKFVQQQSPARCKRTE